MVMSVLGGVVRERQPGSWMPLVQAPRGRDPMCGLPAHPEQLCRNAGGQRGSIPSVPEILDDVRILRSCHTCRLQ